MKNFWDERFAGSNYVYGTAPNTFFKQELDKLTPGKLLLPGEGEGRNAVYAAQQGWQVLAFDSSSEGRKKALQLASNHQVELNYQLASYESMPITAEAFDCIGLVYTHLPPIPRQALHQKLAAGLKPGGTLIMETFSKAQINNNTGGPRDINMLFSKEELAADFSSFSHLQFEELEMELDEGDFHQGHSALIRLIGVK